MKKIYALSLALMMVAGVKAQHKMRPASPAGQPALKTSVLPNIPAINPQPQRLSPLRPSAEMARPGNTRSMTYWEQVIGYSTFDNQTNNSVQDRIILDNDGGVHATWTMSFANDNTFPDRGTGYNSGEGFIWDSEPYERIEDLRTGWPGLLKTGDNKELIICHQADGPLIQLKRNVIGTGEWTQSTIPTTHWSNILWPRAYVDGNTIHLIAIASDTLLNGVNNNLVYWRSQDNGANWDIQDYFFEAITSEEFSRIDGDGYAIHARDGKVSIGVFSEFHDAFLLTSGDNGDTWNYTLVSDFEIPGYQVDSLSDADEDGIADTLFTTDGTGAVHIDANGVTHLVFGSNFILDDTPGDDMYSYFNMQDLLYWNSTFDTDSIYVIASAEEDPDDNDEIFSITLAEIPRYVCSMASMATMAEDQDGNIYVVYSAADEQFIDQQVFRHIYVLKTEDFGESWLAPVELTPDLDYNGYEYVFPSVNRYITDQLHIVVQRDYEPGLSVRGDLDPIEENEIVYFSVTPDFELVLNTNENVPAASDVVLYPNPSNGKINLAGKDLNRQTIRVFDAAGKQVVQMIPSADMFAGNTIEFDFNFLPAGSYSMVLGFGENKISKEFIISK